MAPFSAENIVKVKRDFHIPLTSTDLQDPLAIIKMVELLIDKTSEASKDPSAFSYAETTARDLVVSIIDEVDFLSDSITPGSKTALEELIAGGVDLPNTAAGMASANAILACLNALFRHACASLDTSLVDAVAEQLVADLEDLIVPEDPGGAGEDHVEYLALKLEYDKTKKRLEAAKLKIKNLYTIYVFAVIILSARSRGLCTISTATILNNFKAGGTPAQLAHDTKELIRRSSKYHKLVGNVDIFLLSSDTFMAMKVRKLAHHHPIGANLQAIWTNKGLSPSVAVRQYNKALESWAYMIKDILPPVSEGASVNLVFPPCKHCGKTNHHENTCFANNPALLKEFREKYRLREASAREEALPGKAGAREEALPGSKMSKADLDAFGKKHFIAAIAEPEIDLVAKYITDLMRKEQSTLKPLPTEVKAKLIDRVRKAITETVMEHKM